MDTHSSLLADRRLREFFAREAISQKLQQDSDRRAAEPKVAADHTIITLSREYGTGGHTIASLIAENLGGDWQIWDREIVDAIATNAGVRKEMVERVDERWRSATEQLFRYATNWSTLAPDHYYHRLVQVLLPLAQQGRKIIIGRGANYILKGALKVRLVASHEYRAHAIMESEGLSLHAAESKMRNVDHERREFVRAMFQKDIDSISGYDLIVRLDDISMDTAARLIVAGLKAHMEPSIIGG